MPACVPLVLIKRIICASYIMRVRDIKMIERHENR